MWAFTVPGREDVMKDWDALWQVKGLDPYKGLKGRISQFQLEWFWPFNFMKVQLYISKVPLNKHLGQNDQNLLYYLSNYLNSGKTKIYKKYNNKHYI